MQAGDGVWEASWRSAKGSVVCAERKCRCFAAAGVGAGTDRLEQRGTLAAYSGRYDPVQERCRQAV